MGKHYFGKNNKDEIHKHVHDKALTSLLIHIKYMYNKTKSIYL